MVPMPASNMSLGRGFQMGELAEQLTGVGLEVAFGFSLGLDPLSLLGGLEFWRFP